MSKRWLLVLAVLLLWTTEAHASNGLVNLINGNNVAAQTALRRAIELNPGYSMAHMWLGNSLTSSGQTEQGYRAHNRALSVDPLHPTIVSNTAFDLHFLGRAEAALDLYRKHLAAAGPSSMSYRALTGLHGMSGQLVAALDWARKAIALDLAAAGADVIECQLALAKTGDNVVAEALRDQGVFYEFNHYPVDDVYDTESHSQYYYHAHREGEHGHFHTYLRSWPRRLRPCTRSRRKSSGWW